VESIAQFPIVGVVVFEVPPLLDEESDVDELPSDAQLLHTKETKTTNKTKIFNFFMLTP
jgi:hypothetical protein